MVRPLCKNVKESIQHLFFSCPVTGNLWQRFLTWQGIVRSNQGWIDEVQWAQRYCKGKNRGAGVYKMVLVASVFQMWQEETSESYNNLLGHSKLSLRKLSRRCFKELVWYLSRNLT